MSIKFNKIDMDMGDYQIFFQALEELEKELTTSEKDAEIAAHYLCFVENVSKLRIDVNKKKIKIKELASNIIEVIKGKKFDLDKEQKDIIIKYSEFVSNELDCTLNMEAWDEFITCPAYVKLSRDEFEEAVATYGYSSGTKWNELSVSMYFDFLRHLNNNPKNILEFGYSENRVDLGSVRSGDKVTYKHTKLCDNNENVMRNEVLNYYHGINSNIVRDDILSYSRNSSNKGKYDLVLGTLAYQGSVPKQIEDEIFDEIDKKAKFNGSSLWTYIKPILDLLSDNGKAAIIMPSSSLTSEKDRELRKWFVENGYIEASVAIRDEVIDLVNGPKTLLILSKNNKKIKYFDMRSDGKYGFDLSAEAQYKEYMKDKQFANFEEAASKHYRLDYYSLSLKKPEYKKSVKIKDIALDVFRGCQNLYESPDDKKNLVGPFEVVNTSYITDNSYDCFFGSNNEMDNKYIDAKKEEQYTLVKGIDVLVTCKFSNFKTALYNPFLITKRIPSGNLMVLRVDKEKIDPEYVAAYLNSKEGRKQIELIATGDSLYSINKLAFMDIDIPIYDKDKMRQIAKDYKNGLRDIDKMKRNIEDKEKELKNLFN